MKKLTVFAMFLSLVVAFAAATLANDLGPKYAEQFCAANDDLGFSNHGKCVALIATCYGPRGEKAICVCKEFLAEDPSGFYTEYNNLGECVNHLQNGYVFE